MGLAGRFSEGGYVCRTCGQKSDAYSPNCPNCWKGCLKPISSKRLQAVGKAFEFSPDGDAARKTLPPIVYGIMAMLLAAGIAAAFVCLHGSEPASMKPAETTIPTTVPSKVPAVRHVRHVTAHPAVRPEQAARIHSTPPAGTTTRSHVAPMKLWEVNRESEGQ